MLVASQGAVTDRSATGAVSRSKRATWALMLGLVALFGGLRLMHIDADPPNWIRKCYTRELYAEAPAKAHEARNYALFGRFHVNENDNYQFWRAQSPLWVYPLAAVFETFGTDYAQLRTFSVLYATFGFLVVLWLGAPHLSRFALAFLGVVIAFDRVFFHYTRVGLLEPAVSAWLGVSVLALIRAHTNIWWLLLAHLAFAVAFFTKQAAFFAVPVVVLGTVTAGLEWRRSGAPAKPAKLVAAGSLGLLLVCLLYMATDGYQRAVDYNAGHILLGSDAPLRNRWQGLSSVLFRFTDAETYWHFWVTQRVSGPIALATVIGLAVAMARGYRPTPFQLLTAVWFLCACVAMIVIAKSELRFWTLVVAPSALVAAGGLDQGRRWLARLGRRPAVWLSRLVIPAAITLVVSANARGLGAALMYPTYTLRDAAESLEAHLGDVDATIIGIAAPQIIVGTPYKNYYVRGDFNATRNTLKRLGITHFLFYERGDHSGWIIRREFPRLMRWIKPELAVEFRGQRYLLYSVGKWLDRFPFKPDEP